MAKVIKKNSFNIWKDSFSGGWIAEVKGLSNCWIRLGWFGTRKAAVAAAIMASK